MTKINLSLYFCIQKLKIYFCSSYTVTSLPGFYPDVIPDNGSLILAYSPKGNQFIEDVMKKTADHLNVVGKTNLEESCGYGKFTVNPI